MPEIVGKVKCEAKRNNQHKAIPLEIKQMWTMLDWLAKSNQLLG